MSDYVRLCPTISGRLCSWHHAVPTPSGSQSDCCGLCHLLMPSGQFGESAQESSLNVVLIWADNSPSQPARETHARSKRDFLFITHCYHDKMSAVRLSFKLQSFHSYKALCVNYLFCRDTKIRTTCCLKTSGGVARRPQECGVGVISLGNGHVTLVSGCVRSGGCMCGWIK